MTTSTDIVLRGGVDLAVIAPLSEYANQIAKTEFVPTALRNRPEAVLACFMTGQELGINPMQSLRQIDIIDGRPALRAELMRALVLREGHRLWYGEGNEFSTSRVVAFGKRDEGDQVRVEWTMDMAKQAGLDRKNNWRNAPRAMLAARATSEVCRLLFPDIVAGMGYTAEELSDGFDDVVTEGEVIDDKPRTVKKSASARTTRTRKAAAPAPAPTAAAEPALPDEDDIEDAEVIEDEAPSIPVEKTAEQPQTAEEKERSIQVVRLAKALKLDHHPIVFILTNGVKDSASRLTAQEASDVMDSLRAIENGRAKLVTDEETGEPRLEWIGVEGYDEPALPDDDDIVEAEVVEDEDDPEDWDADKWRAYLAERNVKVTAVLRNAARIAQQGETPVGSLQSIQGSGFAGRLKAFVDDQVNA